MDDLSVSLAGVKLNDLDTPGFDFDSMSLSQISNYRWSANDLPNIQTKYNITLEDSDLDALLTKLVAYETRHIKVKSSMYVARYRKDGQAECTFNNELKNLKDAIRAVNYEITVRVQRRRPNMC